MSVQWSDQAILRLHQPPLCSKGGSMIEIGHYQLTPGELSDGARVTPP